MDDLQVGYDLQSTVHVTSIAKIIQPDKSMCCVRLHLSKIFACCVFYRCDQATLALMVLQIKLLAPFRAVALLAVLAPASAFAPSSFGVKKVCEE